MLNFLDPKQDPEEKVHTITEMSREMDPEIDMENMKLKEETRNRLSDHGYFGFTFSFLEQLYTDGICSEDEFLSVYISFIYIHFANLFIFFLLHETA